MPVPTPPPARSESLLAPPPPAAEAVRARWVSWRSILLGTLAVILVCGLVPYNDYVLANTYLVGSYLPVVMVIFFFILIVLINAPLQWAAGTSRAREQAGRLPHGRGSLLPDPLTSGELAVIMGMMLVAASLPSSGMMRILIPMLVAPFHFGGLDERFWNAFVALGLPEWLFPPEQTTEGRTGWIVAGFYNRVQEGVPIPFAAWVVPLAAWGVFFFALFATMIALAILIRPQWADNERLPFPIAQLQLALIESPRPGRMLNDLLGSRVFWIGLCAVFFIQSVSALHVYFPQTVPQIPLRYDLTDIFANEPWVHFAGSVKSATIFFTFIGITYFIQSRVGFSLWAIFLIMQIISVQQRMMQREIHGGAWMDQHLGAGVAFVAGMLYIGRHHWWLILRQTLRGRREGEPGGDFLSHRTAMIIALSGLTIMFLWLWLLGVQAWIAVVLIGFILLAHLVVARLVAETGMPFFRAFGTFNQVYTNFSPAMFSGRDIFFSQTMSMMGAMATREALTPFALHSLQVYEGTQPGRGAAAVTSPSRDATDRGGLRDSLDRGSHRRGFLILLAWALVLGFVIAAASSLYSYYSYASPVTDRVQEVVNPWGSVGVPNSHLVGPMRLHDEGRFPPKPYNSWLNMGIGAGVAGFLQFAALRWTGWPFMPVGYIIAPTFYAHMAWFSILIGWTCKVLIVKYGGSKLFQQARPFFVGIIFGEALAAGVWLLITIVLAQMGYDYQVIRFLPD